MDIFFYLTFIFLIWDVKLLLFFLSLLTLLLSILIFFFSHLISLFPLFVFKKSLHLLYTYYHFTSFLIKLINLINRLRLGVFGATTAQILFNTSWRRDHWGLQGRELQQPCSITNSMGLCSFFFFSFLNNEKCCMLNNTHL